MASEFVTMDVKVDVDFDARFMDQKFTMIHYIERTAQDEAEVEGPEVLYVEKIKEIASVLHSCLISVLAWSPFLFAASVDAACCSCLGVSQFLSCLLSLFVSASNHGAAHTLLIMPALSSLLLQSLSLLSLFSRLLSFAV